jgi:hypothetical protein
VPAWENVQVPLQFVPLAEGLVPMGMFPVHAGVAGPPTHSTPCGTAVVLLIVTAPPALTVAIEGTQE